MLKERAHLMAADSLDPKLILGIRRGACHQHQWPEIVLAISACGANKQRCINGRLNLIAPPQKGA
jgi:hypothetical protein